MDASWLVCTSFFTSLSRHLWCFSIVGKRECLVDDDGCCHTQQRPHDEYCPTDPARLRFLRLGADASDEHHECRSASGLDCASTDSVLACELVITTRHWVMPQHVNFRVS